MLTSWRVHSNKKDNSDDAQLGAAIIASAESERLRIMAYIRDAETLLGEHHGRKEGPHTAPPLVPIQKQGPEDISTGPGLK